MSSRNPSPEAETELAATAPGMAKPIAPASIVSILPSSHIPSTSSQASTSESNNIQNESLPDPFSSAPWPEQLSFRSSPSEIILQSPSNPTLETACSPTTPNRHLQLNNIELPTPPNPRPVPQDLPLSLSKHISSDNSPLRTHSWSASEDGSLSSDSSFERTSPVPVPGPQLPSKLRVRDLLLYSCLSKVSGRAIFLARRMGVPDADRFLAIKIMKKENDMTRMHQILQEGDLLERCRRCLFIVRFEQFFQDSLHYYLVAEYHQGGDLRQLITCVGPLGRDKAQFYAAEIFLGIDFLHYQKIIHRDIKPENVLIKDNGHICIADLGLAELVSSSELLDFEGNPQIAGFAGTVEYACPEMHSNTLYSYDADWWSYGVTVYFLVQASVPWFDRDRNLHRISMQIITDPLGYWKPDILEQATRGFLDALLQKPRSARLVGLTIPKHKFFESMNFPELSVGRVPPPLFKVEQGDIHLRDDPLSFSGSLFQARVRTASVALDTEDHNSATRQAKSTSSSVPYVFSPLPLHHPSYLAILWQLIKDLAYFCPSFTTAPIILRLKSLICPSAPDS